MSYETIYNLFMDYLTEPDLLKAAIYPAFESHAFGLQLFYSIILFTLSIVVFIKTKSLSTAVMVFVTLLSVLVELILPEATKLVYFTLVTFIAVVLYNFARKKNAY